MITHNDAIAQLADRIVRIEDGKTRNEEGEIMLFENDTRAAVKLLSNRSFHSNKTRNRTAILAIALTAFLFASVIALAFGVQSSMTYSLQIEKGQQS